MSLRTISLKPVVFGSKMNFIVMLSLIQTVIDFILHIDVHLAEITSTYGLLTYGILFLIIFAETGFVVTPFLPGDSLLFAAGAIAALGSLNVWIMIIILILAAVLGDTINYWIGHFFGEKITNHPKIPINPEHIEETKEFFHKHGGKTIILARFVPIVRTFAPFVAGVGQMSYSHFIAYNVIGGVAWILLFTFGGYLFGNIPAVQHNFTFVILGIIAVSLIPMFYHTYKGRSKSKSNKKKKVKIEKLDDI